VARLGGDEFAILLPKADASGASLVASRIVAALGEPVLVHGERLDIGISVGIAVCPTQAEGADDLVHCADVAMYTAKRARCGYTLYQPEQPQDRGSDSRMTVEPALECAAR
jgi:diguanylate cyclase (GGDEF)-like protein